VFVNYRVKMHNYSIVINVICSFQLLNSNFGVLCNKNLYFLTILTLPDVIHIVFYQLFRLYQQNV
jgi:hypothetical protein